MERKRRLYTVTVIERVSLNAAGTITDKTDKTPGYKLLAHIINHLKLFYEPSLIRYTQITVKTSKKNLVEIVTGKNTDTKFESASDEQA